MVLAVVMYRSESWTIKKAECLRIDAFELWGWKIPLRIPWTVRRSNQSILKEISPECSLEGLMLKLNSNTLAAWCQEPTHWKRPWSWERLKVRGEGDDRGWDGWMASPTQWTWVWAISGSWWWTGKPGVPQSRLSNWTELAVVLQSLSCVQLFANPWTAARRLLCPLLSPGVWSDSCLLSQWCYLTISCSAITFSSCLQSFPVSGSFPVSQLFLHQVTKLLELQYQSF